MGTNMRGWIALLTGALALGCGHSTPPPKTPAKTTAPPAAATHDDVPSARHALNRFAFGPRPGQAESVAREGVEKWLERQLGPAPESPELAAALEPYRAALAPPSELLRDKLGDDWMDGEPGQVLKEAKRAFRRHTEEVALAEVTRHILSERQLQEVMVDFWTNHFNVFARKGFVRLFVGDWVERVIRPNALGKFEDLLVATAEHPAMLIYLDNARSVAERDGRKRGLNENYARELLELHTLGADAGYTQADVVDVARILTGWSVRRPREGSLGFMFRDRAHDDGEKHVLGRHFEAGHGKDEGLALLHLLATHPATARHLGTELCQRFVADDPPSECVQAASEAFVKSGGEIAETLRAIFRSPSFWSAPSTKLKSPLELVVSSARALDARPDGTLALARTLGRMGEPLLGESVPTGYPEAEADWLSSSGALGRMGFAALLAAGRVPGLSVDLDRVLPTNAEPDELLRSANQLVLSGQASNATLKIVREEIDDVKDPRRQRALALALLMGGPEFQRQ
jgi:uncharacterized protein (DUF1800 family)